jgi:hypothetical protein
MAFELLRELQNWKLEAKLEDSERYFFEVAEVDSVRRGSKSYVIGRKGTGKTAIGEKFLTQKKRSDSFSTRLSFKNFPFNELYRNKDLIFTRPNQFITIWKYIIYMSVCQLMRDNPRINYDARADLQKLLPSDDITNISRLIPRWVGRDFELKIFGSGGRIGVDKRSAVDATDWGAKVEILEKFISTQIDNASYFILFDELDEDYKDVIEKYQSHEYIDLITSLFKAVQDVRSIFKKDQRRIYPVIFIRDDIYELIQDSDKNKWNDLKVELNWDESKIRNLLAFRISRARDPSGEILRFDDAWHQVFERGLVPVGEGQRKGMSIFEYIARSTLLRPRDFVRYLQVAAAAEIEKGSNVVSPFTVRSVDKAFSNYLRNEFVDEIHAVLPDINVILDIFSQLRKQTLKISEFKNAYQRRVEQSNIKNKDSDLVLRILFHFSVIGNVGNNVIFFRYINREATLNLNEGITIHRGLFKSLQII